MSTGLYSEWKQNFELNFEFRIEAARRTYLGDERLRVKAAEGLAVITSSKSEYGKTETVRWHHRDESGRRFELQRKIGRMRKKSLFLFLEESKKRGITIIKLFYIILSFKII